MSARSPSPASALLLFVLLALSWATGARADTLVLGDRLVFGRLDVSIGTTTIRFAPDCGAEQNYPRGDVKRVERNGACRPQKIRPYSAGGDVCTETPLQLYEVALKGPNQSFLASEIVVANGRMHVRTPSGLMAMHGSDRRFVSATRGLFCRNALPPDPQLRSFCSENVPWAVNFGSDPVFDNRILTRGISFSLEDDRGQPIPVGDPRSTIVRDAFGNAISQWMGALQDLGPRLPEGARHSLSGMISTSPGGYSLMTPPQVVRVGCPDTAMFVVRYLTKNAGPLTIAGHVKAARAEVAGRTIYINGVTIPCWKASLKAELLVPSETPGSPACMNLTPIFVHELGHAFGLPGHRDTAPFSIMDRTISPDLIWPTANDAMALATVLLQPVQGAAAGRLDADGMGVEIRLTPRPSQPH